MISQSMHDWNPTRGRFTHSRQFCKSRVYVDVDNHIWRHTEALKLAC
jgi:hypothetical protein